MLERTDAITKEVLEPITFVLAYPTVLTTTDIFLINNATIEVKTLKEGSKL